MTEKSPPFDCLPKKDLQCYGLAHWIPDTQKNVFQIYVTRYTSVTLHYIGLNIYKKYALQCREAFMKIKIDIAHMQ